MRTRLRYPAILFVVSLYLGCLAVFWVGYSSTALWVALILTHLRGFGVTAGYHRYFAHRSYRTSRPFQFILGFLGASALVGSPLTWCASHHLHHRVSDGPEDLISPVQHGFWWSQLALWAFVQPSGGRRRFRGFDRYAEIRWLDRWWLLPGALTFGALYVVGEWLAHRHPELQIDGAQLLTWGGFISTIYLYQVTSLVNSWCHRWGSRPFRTGDNSRNSLLVGILAMGEGWHNNHHRFPYSERQGLAWWQVDVTHYLLALLAALGIVWELKTPVPGREESS
jgi:stearoyl-CoA desaturase (delta-9 desaturase)